jgi:hypothetical protein
MSAKLKLKNRIKEPELEATGNVTAADITQGKTPYNITFTVTVNFAHAEL